MSCESLALQLTLLSESLLKYDSRLTDEAFGKPLKAFQKSLKTFESTLNAIVAEEEDGPDIRALRGRLDSPAAKLLADPVIFAAFTKGILGKKFPVKKTETLGQAKKRFVEYLLKNRFSKKAVKTFDILVRESNAPEIDDEDETILLREIRYIGSLDDGALELAFATKYKSEKLVRRMAAAAHLRVTAKSTFSSVFKKLVSYARNSFANTSF